MSRATMILTTFASAVLLAACGQDDGAAHTDRGYEPDDLDPVEQTDPDLEDGAAPDELVDVESPLDPDAEPALDEEPRADDDVSESDDARPATSAVELGVLALLNDQSTTFELLDVDCAIRSDSARNIIAHRDGADAVAATEDDDPFETLSEVRAVDMVGAWTIERLVGCADIYDFIPSDGEAAMINLLNDVVRTDRGRLDYGCQLRTDAAVNLVAYRDGEDGVPGTADDDLYGTVDEIESVYMVGPRTIARLIECADDYGYGSRPRQMI